MKVLRFLTPVVVALALAACDDDGSTVNGPRGPRAYIRFVHAVPDTGVVDFRFVDRLENLPTYLGVPFRGTTGAGYQAVAPGSRQVRIFPNSSVADEARQRLVDTTIVLEPNARYTLVYAGKARGNQDRLAVIEDVAQLPTPASGQIALRTVHAAVDAGATEVTVTPEGTGASTTPVATFANLAYLTVSDFANVAVRPSGSGNLYRFSVAPAAGASFSVVPNEPGAPPPANTTHGPTPGMQIEGSVLTGVLVPGAVAGSKAATAGNLTPSVIILIDRSVDP